MGGSSSSSSQSWWDTTKVKDIAPPRKGVVFVTLDDTIEQSLEKLYNNHILSAPILAKKKKVPNPVKEKKCLGFWGMDDLLINLLKATNSPLTLKHRPRSGSIKSDSNPELEHRHKTFHSQTISNCTWERTFHGISLNQPIHDAMIAFAAGVPRIAVFSTSDMKGNVKNIITQSSVLKYIAEDTSRLGGVENLPAIQLGIKWNRIIKVQSNLPTIDAIQLIHDKGVTDVPIVDADDTFIAHLSLSDFKSIHQENDFQPLLGPVVDWVKKVRDSQNKELNASVTAPETSSVKEIVKIIADNHVHYLYLVDSSGKPKSLLTLTHICHKVFHHK